MRFQSVTVNHFANFIQVLYKEFVSVFITVFVEIFAQPDMMSLVKTEIDFFRRKIIAYELYHFIYKPISLRFVYKQDVVYIRNIGVFGNFDEVYEMRQNLNTRNEFDSFTFRVFIHFAHFLFGIPAA